MLLAPPAEATVAATVARSTPDVATVAASTPVGGYAGYTVTLSVDPYGASGSSAVARFAIGSTGPPRDRWSVGTPPSSTTSPEPQAGTR